MKKILTMCLCAIMIILTLSSCSGVSDSSVVATINGEDLLKNEYDYFLMVAKESILYNAGQTEDTKEFWETTEIDGKKAGELAKELALEDAVTYTLLAQKAKAAGISADTAEAKEQINSAFEYSSSMITSYGLNADGVKSVLKKLYLESALINKLESDGTIDVSDETLKKIYESNFRTIKHILISLTDSTTGETLYTKEQAQKLANDISKKLNSGSDFDTLMNEISTDPGLATNPDGYTFTNNGSMVAPFEEKAFSMEIGEISEPVWVESTNYSGYHILKREPLISYEKFIETDTTTLYSIVENEYLTNLIKELKADAKVEKNDPVYSAIILYE